MKIKQKLLNASQESSPIEKTKKKCEFSQITKKRQKFYLFFENPLILIAKSGIIYL